MKDWMKEYNKGKRVPKFQAGGTGPAAPQSPQGGDPAAQLEQMVMEYAQSRDPQLAVAIADMLVAALEAAQQPEAAPAAPVAKEGMRVPGGPVFKKTK